MILDSQTLKDLEHKAQWNDHLPWIYSKQLFEEIRKLQEREAAFREALKHYAKAFHEPFKDAHTLHASGFTAREVLAKYPEEKE